MVLFDNDAPLPNHMSLHVLEFSYIAATPLRLVQPLTNKGNHPFTTLFQVFTVSLQIMQTYTPFRSSSSVDQKPGGAMASRIYVTSSAQAMVWYSSAGGATRLGLCGVRQDLFILVLERLGGFLTHD